MMSRLVLMIAHLIFRCWFILFFFYSTHFLAVGARVRHNRRIPRRSATGAHTHTHMFLFPALSGSLLIRYYTKENYLTKDQVVCNKNADTLLSVVIGYSRPDCPPARHNLYDIVWLVPPIEWAQPVYAHDEPIFTSMWHTEIVVWLCHQSNVVAFIERCIHVGLGGVLGIFIFGCHRHPHKHNRNFPKIIYRLCSLV